MLIRGRVVDAAERPVVGASVYVVRSPSQREDIAQLTDDQGVVVLAARAPGTYTIGARTDTATGEASVDVGGADVEVRIVLSDHSG